MIKEAYKQMGFSFEASRVSEFHSDYIFLVKIIKDSKIVSERIIDGDFSDYFNESCERWLEQRKRELKEDMVELNYHLSMAMISNSIENILTLKREFNELIKQYLLCLISIESEK